MRDARARSRYGGGLLLLIAVAASVSVSQASTARNSAGCAKLYATMDATGFQTYLQSYASDCATPVHRACREYQPLCDNSVDHGCNDNDFRVRTHFLHQEAGGAWVVCDALTGRGDQSCLPQAPSSTYEIEGWGIQAFDIYLGTFGCGGGSYKIVAEGELMTSAGVLYLTDESPPLLGIDACAGRNCDDGNPCTRDSCGYGTCNHEFTAGCMASHLKLLVEDDSPETPPAPRMTGSCRDLPLSDCAYSLRAPLAITGGAAAPKKSFTWKWQAAAPDPQPGFGDPTTADRYALCFYEEGTTTFPLVASLALPPGTDCASGTCWRPTSKGFVHVGKSPTRRVSASISAGPTRPPRLMVKGSGTELDVPRLPVGLPLRVQLQGPGDRCWEARYGASNVPIDDAFRMRGR